MKLSNNVYDVLKWVGLIVLPAIATLVKAVFPAWNLPYADAIATTCTALGVFVGALIGISSVGQNNTDAITSIVTDAEEREGETEYTEEAELQQNEANG